MHNHKNIFLLLRVEQWTKSLFIFLPMFFDRRIFSAECWLLSIIAFLAFCFLSSAIYVFNDIYDVDNDRLHPKKCNRPIASGAVSTHVAWILCFSCLLASAGPVMVERLFLFNSSPLWIILLVYFVLNLFYTLRLKEYAIVDVFIIAIGFVLRVVAGAVVCGIHVSHWIILMTFLLALFLALAKRRDDVLYYNRTGVSARKNIVKYNIEFLNQSMTIVATMTMLSYVMYTVSDNVMSRIGSDYVYITAIFVLAGIIKYLQITIIEVNSGSPTKVLLKNHFIQACVVGWIITFCLLLYL